MVLTLIPLLTTHKIKDCGLPAGGSNCSIALESIAPFPVLVKTGTYNYKIFLSLLSA